MRERTGTPGFTSPTYYLSSLKLPTAGGGGGGPEGPTHGARLSQVPNQLRSLEAFRRKLGIRKQMN